MPSWRALECTAANQPLIAITTQRLDYCTRARALLREPVCQLQIHYQGLCKSGACRLHSPTSTHLVSHLSLCSCHSNAIFLPTHPPSLHFKNVYPSSFAVLTQPPNKLSGKLRIHALRSFVPQPIMILLAGLLPVHRRPHLRRFYNYNIQK